jgi:ectoine hydroxylase-related dioxygenase (phytanoyl-CoA dioxygenase family)
VTEPVLEPDNGTEELLLNDLGWVGVDPDSEDLNKLRAYLLENNGIKGIEVVLPNEVERAAQLFHRDGFVVVRDVLDIAQLEFLRSGCDRVIHDIMRLDKNRQGNRGSHRYSFGSASLTGQLLHYPEWAMLVDLPTVTPIVTAIFGAPTYLCRGGAGDFCLPGAVAYQRLHSDIGDRRSHGDKIAGSFLDHRGILTYRDLPVPSVACNFLTIDFTQLNGPTRQIPGTQHARDPLPRLADEPEWMKLSTVCPAPAGSVLIRDIRAWHGGTPNLSNEVRSIPNVEYWAPWYREPLRTCMPRHVFEGLSDHGKNLCQYIVADTAEELHTGYRDDLGKTPRLMRPEYQDRTS